MPGMPWDEALAKVWGELTKGRRRYVFYPLFAIFVGAGIISIFLNRVLSILDVFTPDCVSKTQEYLPGDHDVMNEWVLLVGAFASPENAKEDRARFVAAMFRDSIRPHLPSNANEEKILIVRDPKTCGHWLEVLDLVPGDGSEEMQRFWRDSLDHLGRKDPGSEMSRWIRRSRPYYYSREEYERMYGKIEETQQ
jgi:hypothetical protein